MVVSPIKTTVTHSMERGYQRIIRCYPNSKIRVTKTHHPYWSKFCGLGGLTQFTVNKRNQLVELMQNYLYSICKSELAQLDICGRTKLFMIILERSTSVVSFCSLAAITNKTYFTWLVKIPYSSRLTLNNLTKWKSWQEKFHCSRFCLISVRVRAIVRILVNIKSFGQYKNCH